MYFLRLAVTGATRRSFVCAASVARSTPRERETPSLRPSSHPRARSDAIMYHHVKSLMYTVRVGVPDPRFGNMLLEQFGGANGELAAAMQYSIQGFNCDDPERKDLLMDIGTEELSHLEVVGN